MNQSTLLQQLRAAYSKEAREFESRLIIVVRNQQGIEIGNFFTLEDADAWIEAAASEQAKLHLAIASKLDNQLAFEERRSKLIRQGAAQYTQSRKKSANKK